jgi:hypothetical protein
VGDIVRFYPGRRLACDDVADWLQETAGWRYVGPFEERPLMPAIGYCGSGITSAFVVFAMEHVGCPGARLFPGSWREWCRDAAHPGAAGER